MKPRHRARRLAFTAELYDFPADSFNTDVIDFGARIAARHNPRWVLVHGCAQSQLVAALDELNVPILSYTDYRSPTADEEGQIGRTFRHAAEIIFAHPSIIQSLTYTAWQLEARGYTILQAPTSTAYLNLRRPRAWYRRLFNRHERTSLDQVADALLAAGRRCVARRRIVDAQRPLDHARIAAADVINAELALPPEERAAGADPVALYLRASERCVPRNRIHAGRLLRRPAEGFHPLIYASDNAGFHDESGEDPLAHYLRHGAPAGRWSHEIIRPDDRGKAAGISAALHAHMHYPELLPDLLERLRRNRSKIDLILTTTSEESAEIVRRALSQNGIGQYELSIRPNRGRDLWPFFDLLEEGAFAAYEIVGHVHGKRSPHYDGGESWRDFLWTHLVGGKVPTADAVLSRFGQDPGLGIVFPEEPHLIGWDGNLDLAGAFAKEIGLPLPLPHHFDFPVGTMFWARTKALAAFAGVAVTSRNLPEEPLPIDGTILHAIERILPFAVAHAGYRYSTTHVPGLKR